MGNPSIRPSPPAAQPAGPSENGILARIGGKYISAGSDPLPAAGPEQPAERKAVIEVPAIGQVRITYRLNSYKRGRSRNWHWLAIHAEVVPPA